jgi:MFS transporter, DHA1 family, multidrug resistance protein
MTAHGDSSVPFSTRASAGRAAGTATVTTALILTLALQSAVPPFATDMYTPAFPRVTADLATSASLVGLTLTTFFLGMALGQLLGGPLSDQRGRRTPMIAGGLICTLGAVGCALAPSIGLLIVFRVVQGFGGGFAPMVAPVLGGTVLTLGGTWRTVFWFLVGLGLLMMITAIVFVPESLPVEQRHGGGLRLFASGLSEVLRIRLFVGYMLTAALSGLTMMAYIANSSYVLQEQKGLQPMPFALFFASTALSQILLSIVNAKIVGRHFRPRTLIGFGLTLATLAVAALTVGVFALDTPLLLTCAGFLVLMAVQAFIFGNANALAAAEAPHIAGAASAVLGVTQAVAMATSAPLASSGGAATAVPMIWVMIIGVAGSLFAYLVLARPSADRTIEPSLTGGGVPVAHQYLVVANRTLGGQELLDAIRDRMSRGPAEFWVLVPATPTTHLVNDFNALSCAFPVDPDVLPGAADVRTRDQAIAEAKSNLDTEFAIRRDHPLNVAAGYLPLARLGSPTSCPRQNQCSADGHHFPKQRRPTIPSAGRRRDALSKYTFQGRTGVARQISRICSASCPSGSALPSAERAIVPRKGGTYLEPSSVRSAARLIETDQPKVVRQ